MTGFSFFGVGNLGANLVNSLISAGYDLKYIYKKSSQTIFDNFIENDIRRIINGSDIIFVSTQESKIKGVAELIAGTGDISGKIFFHTSNSLTSEVLKPVRDRGGIVASFSPLQTFTGFKKGENLFRGITFLMEGDPEALKCAEEISSKLGAFTLKVDPDKKIFFHISAVISSNLLNSLLRFAKVQLNKAGSGSDISILIPLIRETLVNIEKAGLSGALSGPVKRGETGIVEKHLDKLEGEERQLYKILTDYLTGGG
ncbi:MAG: DUF2520 domain-containing protein [Acidobacteriota bacterium]